MAGIIGFTVLCIFVIIISFALGLIPFFLWIFFIDEAGNLDYMWALTLMVVSIIELAKFIGYLFDKDLDFNFKSLAQFIKNIFKKKKTDKKKESKEVENNSVVLRTIEVVVLIGSCIVAFFYEPHFLNLTFSNIVVKMLYTMLIPLIIINIINKYREYRLYGLFDAISEKFWGIVCATVIGVGLSSVVVQFSFSYEDYNYIGEDIKGLFIYDNREYDDIRASAGFESEYDYLNNAFSNALTTLKANNDINDSNGYNVIKNNLFAQAGIAEYGYSVTDSEWQTDDIRYICVVDSKTREHKIYKLNYRDYSLQESTDTEFKNVRNANRRS